MKGHGFKVADHTAQKAAKEALKATPNNGNSVAKIRERLDLIEESLGLK